MTSKTELGYYTVILSGIISALSVGVSADLCADKANGWKYQDSLDCHGFFVCLKNKSYQAYCDYGEKFDKDSQKCVIGKCPPCEKCESNCGTTASTGGSTTVAPTPTSSGYPNACHGHSEGSIYRDPFDCSKFYFCIGGKETAAVCEGGTYFDTQLHVCNDPDEVECSPISTGTTSTDSTTSTSMTTPSGPLDPYSCDGHHDGYIYRDPYDCRLFHVCLGGNSVAYLCPPGLYFDPNLNTCNDPKEVDCPSDTTSSDFITSTYDSSTTETITPTTTSTTEASTSTSTTEAPTTTSTTEVPTTTSTTEAPTTTSTPETPITTPTTTISTPTSTSSTSSTTPRNGQVDPNVKDCLGKPNGSFVRNPNHCQIYYVCRDGSAVKHSCPVKQWFDDKHFVCNLINFVECAAGID